MRTNYCRIVDNLQATSDFPHNHQSRLLLIYSGFLIQLGKMEFCRASFNLALTSAVRSDKNFLGSWNFNWNMFDKSPRIILYGFGCNYWIGIFLHACSNVSIIFACHPVIMKSFPGSCKMHLFVVVWSRT